MLGNHSPQKTSRENLQFFCLEAWTILMSICGWIDLLSAFGNQVYRCQPWCPHKMLKYRSFKGKEAWLPMIADEANWTQQNLNLGHLVQMINAIKSIWSQFFSPLTPRPTHRKDAKCWRIPWSLIDFTRSCSIGELQLSPVKTQPRCLHLCSTCLPTSLSKAAAYCNFLTSDWAEGFIRTTTL